jgi:hypothetical protein
MKNLVNIQNELKVPKGNLNKFGNYKYRSAEDILEAVKPILLKYDARLTLTDDIVSIGNKIFCKATATLTLDGESVLCNGFAETSEHKGMSAEQTTGTASSYSRKYALNGLFLIDETESDEDSQKPQEIKENKKLQELKFETLQYKQIYEKLLAGTVTLDKVKEFYTLSSEVENALKSIK